MTGGSDADRLAILVHEVRSPAAALAAISEAFAASAIEDLDRRELVALAVAACHGIDRIVLDASLSNVRHEPLDVASLLDETTSSARLRGARVETSVEPGLPPGLGDRVRLRQALDNLVENAVAWSPPGAAVVVGARAGDGELVLFVGDRGPGIPVAERERIFERGARLDRERPGSGIGLAVVRAIAEAHGGSVAVESEPGRGATFLIHLPVSGR